MITIAHSLQSKSDSVKEFWK